MNRRRVLCIVVCGAGPAPGVGTLVSLAHARDWAVWIAATPTGLDFIDVSALEALTGTPVRSRYRAPSEPRTTPSTDAFVVAPCTYNTINKLAAGISDTYALGILSEAIGARQPTVILPFVNTATAARKPFEASVRLLRDEGVRVLLGPDGIEPHAPHSGGDGVTEFPWALGLDAVEEGCSELP